MPNTTSPLEPISAADLDLAIGGKNTYQTVKRDDNLTRIARDNGLTLEQLLAMNKGIKNPDLIHPGQHVRTREGQEPQ